MATTQVGAGRKTLATYRHSMWTARMEAAARGWMDKARNFAACWQYEPPLSIGPHPIRIRRGGEQQLCVRVLWRLNNFVAWSSLDRLPGIHDQRIFCEVARAGDIVRNKK